MPIFMLIKNQEERLQSFINSRKHLKIIQKVNITKMVRAAIYERIITREKEFYLHAESLFGHEPKTLLTEITALAQAMGLSFLLGGKSDLKHHSSNLLEKYTQGAYWGGKKCFLLSNSEGF